MRQEVQQKQQQYEHEKKKREKEAVTSAADTAPVRYKKKRRINKPYSPLFFPLFCCAVYILSFCLPISVGVKQEDHDALLTEVQRLEVELSKIRQDLQGVAGCKGRCEQLDTLQDTVSQILTFVWLCKTIKA